MKKKFVLGFSPKNVTKPITYRLVKDYNLIINILRAQVEPGESGHLVLELEGSREKIDRGISYLKEQGVEVRPLAQDIHLSEEDCVDCGLCTSLCPVSALKLDGKFRLKFDKEKCILCEVCVKGCPTRAITVTF